MRQEDLAVIRERMACIVGLPMWRVTRAADMLCLAFGARSEIEGRRWIGRGQWLPEMREVGEYALHASGCYRLVAGHALLAKADLYMTSENAPEGDESDAIGNRRIDDRVAQWFMGDVDGFVVQEVRVSRHGDLSIRFENRLWFEIFVDVSGTHEVWRFFVPNSEEDHMVVNSEGLEGDDD